MAEIVQKFPISHLVPKNETNSLNFLKKYPNYNGKDVVIAILDSGVDPRAAGLQKIPSGETKVIERFDCSGCGDVDMAKSVAPSEDGYITGLSGKRLKLTESMKNRKDGKDFRIGLKSMHDLYPPRIREKIVADIKLKQWDEAHKTVTAETLRELCQFESKNTNLQNLAIKEKLQKENLDASIEFLNTCEKKFSDLKITYDCILYETENGWRAVIDTTENGDLEKAVDIGEYSKTREMGDLNDFIAVSMNVHDLGNVLEIVGMCSSHGTHVASIACGYHPDNSELDGVAPAAQVISLTIGDGRLGSMETGTALVRAIIKVMEMCESGKKVDVINMSYGEHCHWSNSGRIGGLMSELINRFRVVWVASAGNHGPALCTIGTPPDISQKSFIGVGAYVSPEMMEAEYALREKLPGNVYTWTSRDPCIDGGNAVTVIAPGAAIASVPNFTMSKAQLMNGTSMAAPHVAGSICLLVSGLKQKGIEFTPFSVKRALMNTATKVDYVDKFAQGSGLLNVEKSFDYLVDHAKEMENKVRFMVSVGTNNARGIHMREGRLTKPEEFNVNIEPVFFNDKFAASSDKINFNIRLTLIPSEPWIECGAFLDLCYLARSLVVKIDPTGLPDGVHKASIKAYDSNLPEKGPMFDIPITVVQPIVVDPKSCEYAPQAIVNCKPNTILRDFIVVPKHATWAVLEMISTDPRETLGGKFLVHTMQILPMKYCKAQETQKILPVTSNGPTIHPFKVVGNNILEVCIAKYWSNFGSVPLKYSIKFHGILPKNEKFMHSASGIHRIDLTTLTDEDILPAISLKSAVQILKPTESKISPLSCRDVISSGRQIYQNALTYSFHLNKAQEVAFYVPLFSSVLYESEYESQFWTVFDSNKMVIGCGDAYSSEAFIKMEKGDYTIKLQVRHEKKDLLEKISDANMLANMKLPSAISLDIYKSFNQAIVNSKKFSACTMKAETTKPIYVAPLSSEKLTKAALPSPCSWLEGSILFAKDELGKKVDTSPFQYILIEGIPVKKNNGSNAKDTTKSKLDEFKENLRDFQNNQISKLEYENAEELYKEILTAHPTFLAAHLSLIQNIDSSDQKMNLPFSFTQLQEKNSEITALKDKLYKIIDLANLVIKDIDDNSLLAYYGLKADLRPDAAKIKSNMDKQKVWLVEAYVKKLVALSKIRVLKSFDNSVAETDPIDEIDKIFMEVGKFIDYNDSKVLLLSIWHAFANKQYGRMIKYLNKIYEDKLQREVLEEIVKIIAELKWNHIATYYNRVIVTANPLNFRPF